MSKSKSKQPKTKSWMIAFMSGLVLGSFLDFHIWWVSLIGLAFGIFMTVIIQYIYEDELKQESKRKGK